MKIALSVRLFLMAVVPTLVLDAVVQATDDTDFHVRRRASEEAGGANEASDVGSGGLSSPPATDESTLSSLTRVWVEFKKEASHTAALGSVQATIMANLGASEEDASNLLVPEDGASATKRSEKYPFTLHYDFYNSNFPYMVMSVDEATLNGLKADPNVANVEVDPKRYPMQEVPDEHTDELNRQLQQNDITPQAEVIPTGIKMAKANKVWARGYKGQGVTVCVIDTGLDLWHPEFVTSWYGFVNDDAGVWWEDGDGHGTHVTGTIAARRNGLGVAGVAPEAIVSTFKVFNNDGDWAFASEVADAAYSCYYAGARVINMSLGSPEYSTYENNIFKYLYGNGVVSVAAAGNDGTTALHYPASYAGVVSVAAVDSNKRLAPFSQRNRMVDLSAHGVDVLSTVPTELGSYGYKSGTSMASPHVAGVAALLLSKNPSATASKIVSAMTSTALDLGTVGRDNSYGYGLVNAQAALARV